MPITITASQEKPKRNIQIHRLILLLIITQVINFSYFIKFSISEFLASAGLCCSSTTERAIATLHMKTNIDFVGALQLDTATPHPSEEEDTSG